MDLLLTSGGVSVPSIREELVHLLGTPVEESTALCIPTAMYAHPWVGMGEKPWRFVAGREQNPMVDLGWASMGLLELTALPSLDRDLWVPRVLEADALVVAGGNCEQDFVGPLTAFLGPNTHGNGRDEHQHDEGEHLVELVQVGQVRVEKLVRPEGGERA